MNTAAIFLPLSLLLSSARIYSTRASPTMMANRDEQQVTTNHAFTGRMCAASRHEESMRPDGLFSDPLGKKLAGREGMGQPMGAWILVPRTRRGDDFLVERYKSHGARQLVLLGAGMDARAYRGFAASAGGSGADVVGLPELKVFEVDQQTTFDVKEPLLRGERLTVASRAAVGYDFAADGQDGWAQRLLDEGFDASVPTVWLLEGLLYYLSVSSNERTNERTDRRTNGRTTVNP